MTCLQNMLGIYFGNNFIGFKSSAVMAECIKLSMLTLNCKIFVFLKPVAAARDWETPVYKSDEQK